MRPVKHEEAPAEAAPVNIDERLAELRESKAKREEERALEAKRLELEEAELEERFEQELGRRGEAFEIIASRADKCCIVVKLGAQVLYKAFTTAMAKANGNPTPEAVVNYVAPCVVHPSREAFNKIADKRPLVALRCANALTDLYGGKDKDDQGKY